MLRYPLLLILGALLAACAPAPTPQPLAATPDAATPASIEWDTRPDAVVFRMDTRGTSGNRANDLNTLPYCTIYGDGHVIWLNPGINPEEYLEARIPEATLRDFLNGLIDTGFYTWEPQQIGQPEPQHEGPLHVRILLTLFDEPHWLDSTSNWPPDTFPRLLEICRQFSNSPVLYVPTGAWLSALPTTESSNRRYAWDTYAADFDDLQLADIPPESPRWITGEAAATAWSVVRRGRVLLTDQGQTYRLVVQVPGLQPGVPPAPR